MTSRRATPLLPLLRRAALREWFALLAAMLALAGLLGYQNGLGRLDQALYDAFISASGRPARDDIIIVAIDDTSLSQLGRWPWPRALHAKVLDRITEARPRTVGLDIILTEPEQRQADGTWAGDRALQEALERNSLTVLPVIMGNSGTGLTALTPVDALAQAAWSLAHINLQHDPDGVVRSVFLREGPAAAPWPHFALALSDPRHARRAAPPASDLADDAAAGGWQRQDLLHIPFAGNNGHFRSIPYAAVLRGEVPPQFFTGKHVLIGATALGMGDSYPTPVSGAAGTMPGIEIHANILASLLDGKAIAIATPWQVALFSTLPVLIAMLAYLLLAPRPAILAGGALCATVLGLSYLGLRAGFWVAPSAALLALAISYPLWSWRRLEAAIAYLGQEFMRLDSEPHLLPEAREPQPAEQIEDMLERRINAMKTAARRVRDLRQFVSDSLDSLPDATFVTTTEGRILLANRHAACHAGIDRAANGASLAAVLSALKSPQPVDQAANLQFRWSDLLDLRFASQLANGVAATDGHGRDLLVKSAPCYSAANVLSGWIVSIIDITTIRAAERSRDETLRFLSHDMRAPQASILALLELQADPVSAVPQAEFFARIERASRKTLGLADNFVQLARAESQEYRFEEADFQDLLFDATDEMWTLAQSKRIRIVTDVAAAEFPVSVDRTLMTRALVNLLSNAINYSPEDTTVTCTLRHPVDLPANQVFCSIIDQGYGIAAADQARLFQRFQRGGERGGERGGQRGSQVDMPNRPRHDGIGLGLVFVKTVVERHQGQLGFSSELGEGTTFTITLPCYRAD